MSVHKIKYYWCAYDLYAVNSAVTETFSCAASETKTSVCNKNSVLYSGYDASTTKSINEDSITELGDQLHPGLN